MERYGHTYKQLLKWRAWAQTFGAQRRGKRKQLESAMICLKHHQAHLRPNQSVSAPSLKPSTSPASSGSVPFPMTVSVCSLHCTFCSYFSVNNIFQHVRRIAQHHLRQKNTSPKVQLIQSYPIVSKSTYVNWLLKKKYKTRLGERERELNNKDGGHSWIKRGREKEKHC